MFSYNHSGVLMFALTLYITGIIQSTMPILDTSGVFNLGEKNKGQILQRLKTYT